MTGGALNFGISGAASFGKINLSGAAALNGTLSANLNGGYIPNSTNSFAVLSYGSKTGVFTSTNLPLADAWQVVYGSTAVTLQVLNARPLLTSPANQAVNELTLLAVTNIASDIDTPAQTLTFGLVAAPSGMSFIPGTGVLNWTPAQTQSPSTNMVLVSVTDSGTPPLSTTNGFTVVVLEVNVAPSLPAIAQTNVNELTLLTVTNTATESNIHSAVGYALVNPPVGASIDTNGIITWTPSQLQSPGTNTFTTIVTNSNPYDLVNPSLTATNTFTVVVKEVNVPPALSTVAAQMVNELTLLTVTNNATNGNIHSTITGYALVNPPSGMVVNASGVITWTPAQVQSPGTNLITTIVTNSNPYDLANPQLTATNSFTVIVREVNVAPSLPAIAQTNVNELTLLTVNNTATNGNLHSAITGYTLVNPPSGMVISASGVITWTPAQAQSPGTNLITTIVTNSNPYDLANPQLTATNSFTVIVNEVNVVPVLPVIPTQTVNALALLTVTNTAIETDIHATVGYTLVNPPGNMAINASGVITWTPSRLQGPGTNIITTIVTNTDFFDTANPHLSATNSFAVIVYAPTLAPIGNYTVNAGQTVAFTNSATDNDSTRTLSFSLISQPAGATVTPATGVFNWRPSVSQANTTNTMQVSVTDNSAPTLTDTKSFTVTVNPLAPVVLKPMGYANGQFSMSVTGSVGPDYVLQGSATLTNWISLVTNTPGSMPFIFTDPAAGAFSNRFYRAKQQP